ncbi:PQQ-binding-like beta-propeller repeat protein [Thalassoglobus sp. JC818]|uniref:outer membrane protein assembly factor BamB family protein n=1 Tax=Thalassoglobus sp. JC818 TaxID=3232136 RepID=UPI00345897D4
MMLKTTVVAFQILFFVFSWAVPAEEPVGGSENSKPATTAELQKNWPSFRGFGSMGRATDATPPLTWSVKDSVNIHWQTPIAKHGMSSPVVWDDRLFLTGADADSRDIYCFNIEDGELLWEHQVSHLPDSPIDGSLPRVLGETGFAAPTVATNGQLVAAVFATGELVCLKLTGERVWALHLGAPHNHYGHASSLTCNNELLFVQYDQREHGELLALKMETGEPVWRVSRDQMAWSSPILFDNNGRAELILTDSKWLSSYNPKNGEQLWQVECFRGEVASSAAGSGELVFASNEGAAAAAFDVSNHAEGPQQVWAWEGDLPDAASPVAASEYLIVPTAFGVVTCLDGTTGRVHWEHEFGQGFNSSPVVVEDRVYISDLSGKTQVFKLSETFELLGESDIGEPIYATPAFVGDRVYIRGLSHIFCVRADQ